MIGGYSTIFQDGDLLWRTQLTSVCFDAEAIFGAGADHGHRCICRHALTAAFESPSRSLVLRSFSKIELVGRDWGDCFEMRRGVFLAQTVWWCLLRWTWRVRISVSWVIVMEWEVDWLWGTTSAIVHERSIALCLLCDDIRCSNAVFMIETGDYYFEHWRKVESFIDAIISFYLLLSSLLWVTIFSRQFLTLMHDFLSLR